MSRRSLAASALVLAAACSRPAPPKAAAPTPPGVTTAPPTTAARPPSFCPGDTEMVGAEPPAGEVVWCEDADGRKQGPFKSWYESGQLEEEGQYRDGKRVGLWRFYGENGELKGTRPFQIRVTVKVCVFDKATKRALENTLLLVTNIESGDFSTTQTGPFGRADVVVDAGKGRIEIMGLFPRPQMQVDIDGRSRTITFGLESAEVQKILQRNMGRLGVVTSCAR